MLSPKRTKFRKAHKGRIHGNAKGGTQLNFGAYGLKAMTPERVTATICFFLFVTVLSISSFNIPEFFISIELVAAELVAAPPIWKVLMVN